MFDMFRIMALKQQKFSQADPVLIRQVSNKIAVQSGLWLSDAFCKNTGHFVNSAVSTIYSNLCCNS